MRARLKAAAAAVRSAWTALWRGANERMRGRYSARSLAGMTCLAILLLSALMLFVPPYLGLSNDGGFDAALRDAGLVRLDPEDSGAYFNYYERVYRIEKRADAPPTTPRVLRGILRAAIALDTLLTRDRLFDVRFLALLYALLYAAALYPTVLLMMQRTNVFSEGAVIGAASVIIFADVSYITRLTSFTIQPLELICWVSMLGLAFHAAQSAAGYAWFLGFGLVSAVLLTIQTYAGIGGLVLAALCLNISRARTEPFWKAICVLFALFLCVLSVHAVNRLEQTQTDVDKYHAMTRGVLLQSDDPEKTLEEFSIEPRYSILTDTYADQNYPVVFVDETIIKHGFLDRYHTLDIVAHYLRNLPALMNMLDLGVRASFITRNDYSGNYERSVGHPPRAKSPFMSAWSTFKAQSAPRTIGFFLVLIFLVWLLFRHSNRTTMEPTKRGIWSVLAALSVFALLELLTVILYSGDALLLREAFSVGVCMDLLVLTVVSEVLHRLNILQEER